MSLLQTLQAHKAGKDVGVYSVCSANRYVIAACMQQTLEDNGFMLLEATSNQVNQFGGYTGLDAADFVEFASQIAHETGLPRHRLVLGGDHLGPHPWAGEAAASAMEKARHLVSDYARQGFLKLHLDASMALGGDIPPLDPTVAAARAAELCLAAEEVAPGNPVYVIGTEVPPPGGAQKSENNIAVTRAEDVQQTLELHREAFEERGLQEAWERVIAVVVQPGVEFGDEFVLEYDSQRAKQLSSFIENQPRLVYEAHSTDYQTPIALRRMVHDHFAILKVGPALTFAFREAVFALAAIEQEWLGETKLLTMLENAMLADPTHWRRYYQGDDRQQAFARRYSYSDRIRYYWANPTVNQALQEMLTRLEDNPPPLTLLSQFLPVQYWKVRQGLLENRPICLIYDKVREIARHYSVACAP